MLLNLLVHIQISLFVNYSFILYILQFCKCVSSFSVFFTNIILATTAAEIIFQKLHDFFYSVEFVDECAGFESLVFTGLHGIKSCSETQRKEGSVMKTSSKPFPLTDCRGLSLHVCMIYVRRSD